jgi:hypothetical protein
MHKLTKTFLHLWISIASLAAFAFGWAFLAHAQKPAPLVLPQVQIFTPSQPALEPIPTLNDYLKNGAASAPVFRTPTITLPRLRTRGS